MMRGCFNINPIDHIYCDYSSVLIEYTQCNVWEENFLCLLRNNL